MGLDMYALTTTEPVPRPVDFEVDSAEPLHTWRKHPNLHGWMEQLYYAKGGTQEPFNCASVALTLADLDELERAVRSRALPKTIGFFFGQSDGSELADDLSFIAKAREACKSGATVFYSSWW